MGAGREEAGAGRGARLRRLDQQTGRGSSSLHRHLPSGLLPGSPASQLHPRQRTSHRCPPRLPLPPGAVAVERGAVAGAGHHHLRPFRHGRTMKTCRRLRSRRQCLSAGAGVSEGAGGDGDGAHPRPCLPGPMMTTSRLLVLVGAGAGGARAGERAHAVAGELWLVSAGCALPSLD